MRKREEILEALHEADTTERAADIAVDFVMHVLAEAVGVSAWTPSDGSETWDGDVAGTVYSILRAGRVLDEDTDETAMRRAIKAEAERDAARAEAERLRDALKDVASFLPDLEGASRYLRRISDMRPAMEHAAALAQEPGA